MILPRILLQQHPVVVYLELFHQFLDGHGFTFFSTYIHHYPAALHQYRPVAVFQSRLHVVRYHHRAHAVLACKTVRELQHFFCS